MPDVDLSIPKLWFSRVCSGETVRDGQCGDCNCACPTLAEHANIMDALQRHTFEQYGDEQIVFRNRDTFTSRVGSYWTALNATYGRLLVMDELVIGLLDALPQTLSVIRKQFPSWPDVVFARMIALLMSTGITTWSQAALAQPQVVKSSSLAVWLHITEQCNLDCVYCYAPHSVKHMTWAVARRAVDAVFRSAVANGYTCVKLKYAGGEPTLNFDLLMQVQHYAQQSSQETGVELKSVLLTNGIYMLDEQMDALATHCIAISVSQDGLGIFQDRQRPLKTQTGNSFTRVENTLDRLQARDISPHVSVTLTRPSLPGLPDLVDHLLDRDLSFSLSFYRAPTCSGSSDALMFGAKEMVLGLQDAFARIEKRVPNKSLLSVLGDRANLAVPHQHTCNVAHHYLVIDPDGQISKCQMEMGRAITTVDVPDPLVVVRADPQGIQNLAVDQKKECNNCIWRYYCTGGCPRMTFQHAQNYQARSPLCEVYRAILPDIASLEARRLVKYQEPWDFTLD